MQGWNEGKYRMRLRTGVSLPVGFASTGLLAHGTAVHLSEGGLSFLTAAHIDIGSKGLFRLKPFEAEPAIEVEGEIIYEQGQDAGHRVYGARFTRLDERQKEMLARAVLCSVVKGRYANRNEALIDNAAEYADKD